MVLLGNLGFERILPATDRLCLPLVLFFLSNAAFLNSDVKTCATYPGPGLKAANDITTPRLSDQKTHVARAMAKVQHKFNNADILHPVTFWHVKRRRTHTLPRACLPIWEGGCVCLEGSLGLNKLKHDA